MGARRASWPLVVPSRLSCKFSLVPMLGLCERSLSRSETDSHGYEYLEKLLLSWPRLPVLNPKTNSSKFESSFRLSAGGEFSISPSPIVYKKTSRFHKYYKVIYTWCKSKKFDLIYREFTWTYINSYVYLFFMMLITYIWLLKKKLFFERPLYIFPHRHQIR